MKRLSPQLLLHRSWDLKGFQVCVPFDERNVTVSLVDGDKTCLVTSRSLRKTHLQVPIYFWAPRVRWIHRSELLIQFGCHLDTQISLRQRPLSCLLEGLNSVNKGQLKIEAGHFTKAGIWIYSGDPWKYVVPRRQSKLL